MKSKAYTRAIFAGDDYVSNYGAILKTGKTYRGKFYDFGNFILFSTSTVTGVSGKANWRMVGDGE